MTRKASGKQQVLTIKRKRPNGEIYVYERVSEYNPDKRYYVQVSSKLIGKILPGETEIIPTRPKKNSKKKNEENSKQATRNNVGLTSILDWIGKESGIDDDLYNSTDRGTAQKILSIVRYWLANPDKAIPQIEEWQITHEVPYEDGVSTDACYDLMKDIGQDVSIQQKYFKYRAASSSSKTSVAVDSTTIYSYSENLNDVRFGFNKDKNGLPTVKLLTLFSLENHQPIAFIRQPGNIPDVKSVLNSLTQLMVLGMDKPLLVFDSGFFSASNIGTLISKHTKFLMRGQLDCKWILPELNKLFDTLTLPSRSCPFEEGTYGASVMINHTFSDKETTQNSNLKPNRLYLHFYLNVNKAWVERENFIQEIKNVKSKLENGTNPEEICKRELNLMEEYLTVNERKGKKTVHMKDNEIMETIKHLGIFVLVSNEKLDTFKALREYRLREKTEENFRIDKQFNDAHSTRSKSTDALDGRFFIRFVAMGYEEFLCHKISELKRTLDVATGDKEHDKATVLSKEKGLLNWLNKMSISKILAWFDAVQETTVKTNVGRKRWQTEIIERDRLFLEKLGVIPKN